jgi:F-box interacting protein
MGMEVFTIGAGGGGSWRETLADPPYPILDSQTGKHWKGHLFYFINKSNQQQPPRGLLRFSLQNETFGVTLLPSNMDPAVEDDDILVKELDGELCFTYLSKHLQQLVIWVTRDVLNPQWDCRYRINRQDQCYPMASLGGDGLLLPCYNFLFRYDLEGHGG